MPTTSLLRPGDVVGGYRIEDLIGGGGMASVYRAQQVSLGRPEVVGMIVEDMTNAQIAWKLKISDRTVQAHIRNALEKTGARSRVGLAVHALRSGLVDPGPTAPASWR